MRDEKKYEASIRVLMRSVSRLAVKMVLKSALSVLPVFDAAARTSRKFHSFGGGSG